MGIAAALRPLSLALVLVWATAGLAAQSGTALHPAAEPPQVIDNDSGIVPSIEILPAQTHLAGTCGGTTFDVNTFINVDTHASADVRVSVPVAGVVEQFTDDTGANIGPYNAAYPAFNILTFGGGLAPNTPITIRITTYSGPDLSGRATYVSILVFNCTTGAVLSLINSNSVEPPQIPALGDAALAATALLVALIAMVALRRRAVRRA